MKYFMEGESAKFVVNHYYSIELVYDDIMLCTGSLKEQNDFLSIHYKVTIACGDIGCMGHGIEVRGRKSREIPIMESSSLADGKGEDKDIVQLMENYWERKVHTCIYCGKLLPVKRVFHTPNPLILVFSLSHMNSLLNPVINFEGTSYDIFAVAYTDGGHYIGRIKRPDGVYEYDGNYMRGRLQLVNRSDPFAEKIISISGSRYKAEVVWYKKVVIV